MYAFKANEDILPLSEFRKNLAGYITQTRETGRPVIVTQNGRTAGVFVNERHRLRRPPIRRCNTTNGRGGRRRVAFECARLLSQIRAATKCYNIQTNG